MIFATALTAVLFLGVSSTTGDVCTGKRCDTEACPCGCECGNAVDPGLCYVPKKGSLAAIPKTMTATQGSGTSCDKPDWTCISEVKDVAVPSPGVGQVLLAMHGSSVNPVNVDLVEPGCEHGPLGGCSKGTLGNDGAGTVVAVGVGANLKVGDEVWGIIEGSYAQYAIAHCGSVGLKPAKLSFVDAGTFPIVGGTSLQCLQAAGMGPSQKKNLTVVITSGQGGTGFVALQLAKALGATRVITAATGAGINFTKSLGADVVIDYHKQDIADALADDSVDIVFDNLGVKGTADKMMHAIRPGGTFLVLMGGNGGTISAHPKAGVRQVPFGLATAARKEFDELKALVDAGKLQARTMEPTYSLSQVAEAFTRLRSHGVLGKIAVVPDKTDLTLTMV